MVVWIFLVLILFFGYWKGNYRLIPFIVLSTILNPGLRKHGLSTEASEVKMALKILQDIWVTELSRKAEAEHGIGPWEDWCLTFLLFSIHCFVWYLYVYFFQSKSNLNWVSWKGRSNDMSDVGKTWKGANLSWAQQHWLTSHPVLGSRYLW